MCVLEEQANAAFTVARCSTRRYVGRGESPGRTSLAEARPISSSPAAIQALLLVEVRVVGNSRRWTTLPPVKPSGCSSGSEGRIKTIYRTNMRPPRRWPVRNASSAPSGPMPHLTYTLGPSREHRALHVSLAGDYPACGSPWWQTHMPPNGWRLRLRGTPDQQVRIRQRCTDDGGFKFRSPERWRQGWVNTRTGGVESAAQRHRAGMEPQPGQEPRASPQCRLGSQGTNHASGKLSQSAL